jgi:Ni/Fe-hydrogenase 1 B-type cytochrome subunit
MAFFNKFHADWKDFFAWTDLNAIWKQIRFYLHLDRHPPEQKWLYGPVQSIAYAALLFMVLVIVITGLILMGAGYHAGLTALTYKILRPVENIMGGLAMVRYIHHGFTWLFILFIVVHVYMAFWYDVVLQRGTVSSMISGRVFKKVKE